MSEKFLQLYFDEGITRTIERSQKVLGSVGENYVRAARSSLTRAKSMAKTEAGRQAPKQYAITKSTFMNNTRFSTQIMGSGNSLNMRVQFKGYNIPAVKYQQVRHIPKGMSFLVRRDRAAVHVDGSGRGAFLGRIGNKTIMLRRRTSARHPLKQIFGISTASMMKNYNVIDPVETKIYESFQKRMDQEIYRILMGFGN